MLPDEAKTSLHTGETGYDSYLRDAHLQVFVSLCVSACLYVCLCVCVCLFHCLFVCPYVRLFVHCVSKKASLTFLAITRESIDGFLYLAEMLLRKQAIICLYIFPPHLINASALPYETENTEIVCFHVNVSC